jgi:hypothetical protein
MHTRGSGFKGVMGCSPTLQPYRKHRVSFVPRGTVPEALKGLAFPSLSLSLLLLCCLGWRGFWRTLRNTCFYVLRNRPGVWYI